MTAQLDAPVLDFGRLEEFVAKVQGDQAAAYNAILVYLGDRLGLWQALAASVTDGHQGTATIATLAERSGVARRYVQEWLSAQAAHGYVTYDATSGDLHPLRRGRRRARRGDEPRLPDRRLRADRRGLGGGRQARQRVHDRRGAAVARSRPPRLQQRGAVLRDDVPRVAAHRVVPLGAGPGRASRVAASGSSTSGCGLGVPTILLAEAFPNSTFVGVDYHEESIRLAKAAAVEAGSPTGSSSTSRTPRRTTGSTTWCCSSTPSTTWATRSAHWPTHEARSGRAVRWSRSSPTPRTPSRPT